ncbi:MAG: helix-turn-helix transcriptional regulator, partial [Eubacterium sp.]|nr:helix-turn-helix transcriptional regulator [Eubacterium sp.]
MNNPTMMQDSWVSASDPAKICSFDYEAIQEPTKALMHQAARFLYFKNGRGTIEIDGTAYAIVPNTLLAITPWKISDVTEVEETLQFVKVIYDYQYINTVLKGVPGTMDEGSELLRFLSMEPVAYLDSVEARYVDDLMECLKSELGVESTRTPPPDKPFTQLYTVNKLIELIVTYRRYIMSQRGEKDSRKDAAKESSIFSYIYAHSAEKLTLSRVAEVFFVSESTLSKQISQITGSTFMKLLN